MDSDVFTVVRAGHVATLWLDSPARGNAMGPDFWAELPVAMAELDDDPEVRAIVIAAKGKHFCVGLDLASMGGEVLGPSGSDDGVSSAAAKAASFYRMVSRLQASITAVDRCAKPVIAAIHGGCIGGGVDLVSACDIRLAATGAFFSIRETRLAMVADVGTLQRLPLIIGKGHMAELAYTGKDIDAQRAAAIGLVNDVLPDVDALHSAAHALAEEIAANSPLAVQGTKQVLRACADRTVEEGLDYVAVWNAAFMQSRDLTEAITAFFEKRPATFTGQ